MPNKIQLALAFFFTTAVASASAAPTVLTFEGIGNGASVLNFYNGGTDGNGNSGTNYGIEFGSNTLAVIDADAGGSGNFANEPSPNTVMFFLTGSAILNSSAGFDTGFSFFYSSSEAAVVNVYDGLNATGKLLGSINLASQYNNGCSGDPTGDYCNFTPVGVSFAGIAHSIDFGGTVNKIAFDNITFGSAIAGGPTEPGPGSEVPEPGTLALLGLGLLGTTAARRKFSKQKV
ncbi:PEP-CTERM sorting domain-containing protein [Massilia sp. LXY-6]|uniref:PEP-CTERM sorting domain-containing protein n=1 Tax=Massilia sp. LXY-6 TaxID=3379823 RepID=UPI003EE07BE4